MARDNVIVFPRQSKLNIAIVILLAVFVYLLVCVYSFFSKDQIVSYEVRKGTLMDNNRYEAVIIRDEYVEKSEATGYVNYFVAERERVGVGNLVYTLDESGTILDYVETVNLGDNSLDTTSKNQFRDTLDHFVKNYDNQDLGSLYQLNVTLQNNTQKIANNRLLDGLDRISSLNGFVKYNYAKKSGNIAYWSDGLEELTASEVTSTLFDKEDYSVTHMTSNTLVAAGDMIYKLYNSEKWSVAFVAEDEDKAQRYLAEEVVKVRFLKNDISIWANVSLVPNIEGETVVLLDLQSGSVNFLTDRFVEIEIDIEDEEGLKIPVSSIAQKEFFLVPEEYVIYSDAEDTYYINIERYMENSERTIKLVEVTPYSLKDGKYYLDDVNLSLGIRLQKTDSTDTYTVSEKASLTGVYNINKGYADFKQITVKQQNKNYAIVESDTMYGLNVYDYIVLNASAVSEDDFIYE